MNLNKRKGEHLLSLSRNAIWILIRSAYTWADFPFSFLLATFSERQKTWLARFHVSFEKLSWESATWCEGAQSICLWCFTPKLLKKEIVHLFYILHLFYVHYLYSTTVVNLCTPRKYSMHDTQSDIAGKSSSMHLRVWLSFLRMWL